MIGIHDSPGSFSDRWIDYCQKHAIPFTRLNCLATDIMQQCAGLRAVLWHWTLNNPEELIVARQIITALEQTGTVVFPNWTSCWHYDDKIAQKYLLESIGAPVIPTWIFTDQAEARKWIATASWPKVFKLRCGAASMNVRLVTSERQATDLCRCAFGRGFAAKPGYFNDARSHLRQIQNLRQFWQKLRRMPQSIFERLSFRSRAPRQKGYLFFQEFLPGNDFDTRVTIIGNRAFAYIRHNRERDFRASGSGQTDYHPERIDLRCVRIAFDIAEKLGSQSLACDFLSDLYREPKLCEVSYCFVASMVHDCQGYWDRDLSWHDGHVWPQDAILEDLLLSLDDHSERLASNARSY